MRKGMTFKGNKLVLVTSISRSADESNIGGDADVEYLSGTDHQAALLMDEAQRAHVTLLAFMAISIACTTAAIATGSYAIWLARHQATRQTLTDVNEILKSCQTRMQQLEADVQRLPERQA